MGSVTLRGVWERRGANHKIGDVFYRSKQLQSVLAANDGWKFFTVATKTHHKLVFDWKLLSQH